MIFDAIPKSDGFRPIDLIGLKDGVKDKKIAPSCTITQLATATITSTATEPSSSTPKLTIRIPPESPETTLSNMELTATENEFLLTCIQHGIIKDSETLPLALEALKSLPSENLDFLIFLTGKGLITDKDGLMKIINALKAVDIERTSSFYLPILFGTVRNQEELLRVLGSKKPT